MILSTRKRKHYSEVDLGRDRLSELPDDVIVHILSFLPILDAVRTVLLRRFRNLWTLVPILNCDLYEVLKNLVPNNQWPHNEVWRFNIFLRNVVALHKRSLIDKFHLHLGGDYVSGSREIGDDITRCLRFALDKQAKEIAFYDVFCQFPPTNLPDFTSQSLVNLELQYCRIPPQLQVNLGSLKQLLLDSVTICEAGLQQFISGCPSLQELSINYIYCIKKLRFSAPNINKFSLLVFDRYENEDPLVLDLPNLKTLDLEIDRIPHVLDVSSVRNMYLKNIIHDLDDEDDCRMFNIFFRKFEGAQVFQLSRKASEPFLHRLKLIDDLHLLEIRWKRLILELWVSCESCILGFYQLMRSSIHLEELIIYTSAEITSNSVFSTSSLCIHQDLEARFDMPPLEFSSDCVMPKLKTVTLHGYVKPWNRQLHLVSFLLKAATILDKLVIVPTKHLLTRDEELEFVKYVSSFQRASTSARVLFA
ncbi:F-box protein At4g09920-like [Silene latifolia]|uniref:F-box protein At4g09920-like n=1 Tax=Silene latifolia TaxID=37657 RepID=UPI003D76CD8A